jgi:4-hydroxybenzoate polyprenyltransferase
MTIGASQRPAAGHEPQTLAGGSLAARLASFVRLPHTLFALPFAGLGAVLASYTHPQGITPMTLFWIVLAFTAARFAAMGFNRIVDRRLDALNPRTAARELPAGRLTLGQAKGAVAIASAVFVLSAWQLNPLCGWLSPLALAWVLLYSYTKRFTTWSHLVLGFGLGIAPVGAYLAVTGVWPSPWYALVVLAAAVAFWVAGFDTVYALQDVEFDRRHRLHSIPARLGPRAALRMARGLHLAAFLAFVAVWALEPFRLGPLYLGGVGVLALLLLWEHWLVRDQGGGELDLRRIDRAFFHMNVAVSMSLFLFALLDRVLLA